MCTSGSAVGPMPDSAGHHASHSSNTGVCVCVYVCVCVWFPVPCFFFAMAPHLDDRLARTTILTHLPHTLIQTHTHTYKHAHTHTQVYAWPCRPPKTGGAQHTPLPPPCLVAEGVGEGRKAVAQHEGVLRWKAWAASKGARVPLEGVEGWWGVMQEGGDGRSGTTLNAMIAACSTATPQQVQHVCMCVCARVCVCVRVSSLYYDREPHLQHGHPTLCKVYMCAAFVCVCVYTIYSLYRVTKKCVSLMRC